jgi:hypothetical protein
MANDINLEWSYKMQTTLLDPKLSEFTTQEQAEEYTGWFIQKVQEAQNDKRPRIPHDQIVKNMEQLLSAQKM